MKALIIANRLPFPLDDGWKVRTWNIVAAVAAVQPTTLVVGAPREERLLAEAAASFGPQVEIRTFRLGRPNRPWNLAAGILTRRPVSYWNQQSRDAHRVLRGLAQSGQYDLCVAVLTHLYPYLRYFPPKTRRIVDTHNVDSLNMDRYVATLPWGLKRAYAKATAQRLRWLEAEVFSVAGESWVCSPSDAESVHRAVPGAVVRVVPNGADTARFAPGTTPPIPDRMVFFGRLDYFPNHEGICWFLREVFPTIRRLRPGAHIAIVGQGALPGLLELVAATPGATCLGLVEDLPGVVSQASAVVVPLLAGGGTRLKILEALGSARPLVSTTVGAEGLDLVHGTDLLIADRAGEFSDAVLALLADPALAERLGRAGRAAVQARYEWSTIREQVRRLLTAGGGESEADSSPR